MMTKIHPPKNRGYVYIYNTCMHVYIYILCVCVLTTPTRASIWIRDDHTLW